MVPGIPTFQVLQLPFVFHPPNHQEGTTKPNKRERDEEMKKQNFEKKQTKFMKQPLLFTSLQNRHVQNTAALPDGLCFLIFLTA